MAGRPFMPDRDFQFSRWDMHLVNCGHINNAGFVNDPGGGCATSPDSCAVWDDVHDGALGARETSAHNHGVMCFLRHAVRPDNKEINFIRPGIAFGRLIFDIHAVHFLLCGRASRRYLRGSSMPSSPRSIFLSRC
jgi:hypothetical protein